jgi:hypothetical protein
MRDEEKAPQEKTDIGAWMIFGLLGGTLLAYSWAT